MGREAHLQLAYDGDILDEYKEVLRRLHVLPSHNGRVVNLIRARTETISPHSSAEISPDPDDDRFCLCANEGKADFLVTLNLRASRKPV